MPILLVRHAKAGNRQDWPGDDRLRPLSPAGAKQAAELAGRVAPYHPSRILSSPYVRCRETVLPLAQVTGASVEDMKELAEGRSREAVALVRRLAMTVGRAGTAIVLCSHGDVIPEVLDHFAVEDGLDLGPAPRCAKGSTWVLEVDGSRIVSASYISSTASPVSRGAGS